MKLIRLTFSWIAAVFMLAILGLKITGNDHVRKAVASTYLIGQKGPTINDYGMFENRIVETSNAINIPYHEQYGKLNANPELMSQIESYDPVALLYIQHGKVIYDQYWKGYDVHSLTNSFSAIKSVVGLSIGKCIDLGLIPSIDAKVIDYLPELKGTFRDRITLKHLIQMTSGIAFDENYKNPFGFMSKAYYGTSLYEATMVYSSEIEPGKVWVYSGGNTLLMSFIVEKVSGQSLSDFVSTHFWKPLGASSDALWTLDDKEGIEKAYCCFYSNALDFSRFGTLILNDGKVNDKQILSEGFLRELKKPVILNNGEAVAHYGYQCWRMQYKSENITYARGIFGQYIITIPELDMVIVRLGNQRGDKDDKQQPVDMYHYVDLAYGLSAQMKKDSLN